MCGDASRYCPVGSPVPLFVSTGYYSIGGNESTRVSQQIAPEGHYAHSGLLYVCPAGTYGSVPGLSSSSCSGPCRVPGYYCPVGSISPTMKYCGGDDVFCPSTTTAPIKVHSGFYTVDYDYDTCPQGRWRNLTIPITEFTQLKSSPIATLYPISDCQLCPDGTYKAVVGNSIDLCRPCNSNFSVSTDNRIECRCTAVLRSGLVSYFNISTGDCQTLSVIEFNRQDDDQWGRNNSLTRFREFPCEVGHYCINGLRYSCPAGYYGSLGQEIRPLCEGRCATGYFCLEASTSPFSYPCGSANFICPEGSPEPTIVPAGYYSNEDAPEQLRSYQLVCPVGYYCPGDGKRYPCAPGTYTDVEGTISEECLGPCKRGNIGC